MTSASNLNRSRVNSITLQLKPLFDNIIYRLYSFAVLSPAVTTNGSVPRHAYHHVMLTLKACESWPSWGIPKRQQVNDIAQASIITQRKRDRCISRSRQKNSGRNLGQQNVAALLLQLARHLATPSGVACPSINHGLPGAFCCSCPLLPLHPSRLPAHSATTLQRCTHKDCTLHTAHFTPPQNCPPQSSGFF